MFSTAYAGRLLLANEISNILQLVEVSQENQNSSWPVNALLDNCAHRLHGTPRNPYDVNHYTGGSSSGSAVAVASGKYSTLLLDF